MSYENPDTDKTFTGDEDHEKQSKRKEILLGKSRKESKKGARYVMFDEEDSDESSVVSEDVKSPSKMKKSKAFRFSAKKKEKEEKKDRELKKEEKEKEKEKKKEDKDGKKLKLKTKKKSKHIHEEPVELEAEVEKPIFGVPLVTAVERNRSHDGIELPALFRECIDYIEEHGLSCEGIYRISGVKSKVQMLKDCYNKQLPVYLEEHEPNIVASLLKQFLRELPEPVLTTAYMPKFEEASVIKTERRRMEHFSKLISELPVCNRLLLSWMIVHMLHVIERQKENKMSLQNVSIVLSPTMQISHRVLNVLFSHAKQLFRDTEIKRYKPPIKPTTSKWSLELPDNPSQLEEELAKQESLLNALHEELNSGVKDPEKEEQLWEVQRVVTQLKRKIKFAKKTTEKAVSAEKRRKEKEEARKSQSSTASEELVLRLELREAPAKKQAPAPPTTESANTNTVNNSVKGHKEKAPQPPTSASNRNSTTEVKVQDDVTPAPEEEVSNENADEIDGQVKVKPEKGEQSSMDVSIPVADNVDRITTNVTVHVSKDQKPDEVSEIIQDSEDSKEKTDVETQDLTEECTKASKATEETLAKESDVKGNNEETVTTESETAIVDEEDSFEQQVEDILEQEHGETVKDFSEEETETPEVDRKQETEELPPLVPTTAINVTDNVVEESQQEVEEDAGTPNTVESVIESSYARDRELIEDFINEDMVVEDEELLRLQEELCALQLEEEELLSIESELKQKIETETSEIDRLHQEIAELHYLRQDSDLEEMSSSSDSSYESEDEEDLQEILNQLLSENEELEKKNTEFCQKIHEERMICLGVKVQIGMLQQKQLESSIGNDSMFERDLLLF